jgi:hypothetical protein
MVRAIALPFLSKLIVHPSSLNYAGNTIAQAFTTRRPIDSPAYLLESDKTQTPLLQTERVVLQEKRFYASTPHISCSGKKYKKNF